jgi:hypothetical protein
MEHTYSINVVALEAFGEAIAMSAVYVSVDNRVGGRTVIVDTACPNREVPMVVSRALVKIYGIIPIRDALAG